jgi:hypothetical protein
MRKGYDFLEPLHSNRKNNSYCECRELKNLFLRSNSICFLKQIGLAEDGDYSL